MNHISQSGKWRVAPAMTLALAVLLTGCEDLLQVELPSTITTDALDNPDIAEVIVNSAITAVECAYSRFIVGNPTGMEDAMVDHGGGAAIEYQDVISTSGCGSGNNYSWFNPFQEARYTAEDLYTRLDGWTEEELAFGIVNYNSKEQMMGLTALYASVPYQIFGEVMCEVAIERGPLLGPDSILAIGEGWATKAITHIQAHIAAFKLDDGTGLPGSDAAARLIPYGISTDAEAFAYGMRARIRWARGGSHMAGGDRCRSGKSLGRRLRRPIDSRVGRGGSAGEPFLERVCGEPPHHRSRCRGLVGGSFVGDKPWRTLAGNRCR